MTSISFPIIKIQHSKGYRIISGLYYFALFLFLLMSSFLIADYKPPMIVKLLGVIGMLSYIVLAVVLSIRKEIKKEYVRIGRIDIYPDKLVCYIDNKETVYEAGNIYDIKIRLDDYDKKPQGSRGLTLSDGTNNFIKFRDYNKNKYNFRLYVPGARLSEQAADFIRVNNSFMRII